MFQKILIANRGEVAIRIIQACRQLSIKTVAVFSVADRDSLFVKEADEAVQIGPAAVSDSYLNREAILMAGIIKGCDAVHPGYGFLSEDPLFAEMVEECGMTWIGPQEKLMEKFADKNSSRQWAIEREVPVIPGTPAISNLNELQIEAEKLEFPVLLKASFGGGGKGIRTARNDKELSAEYEIVQQEATASFGISPVYLEKELKNPRHIEVQIIGNGTSIQILGNRNCSIQLHRQKVIEESPANLTEGERKNLYQLTHQLLDGSGYRSLGTVEFLYSESQFYFLEMNTRLQVEHGVTELTTGIDIVQLQIQLAAGKPSFSLEDSSERYAIEVRINALSPGKLTKLDWPIDARIDTGFEIGNHISAFYDPLIAKLLVVAPNRSEAILKLQDALESVRIEGAETNLSELKKIISLPEFKDGTYHIHSYQQMLKEAASHGSTY